MTTSRYPIKSDKRYTITKESCGYPEPRFVLRFCQDWIMQSKFYNTCLIRAVGMKDLTDLKEKCYNWMFRNYSKYEHDNEINLTFMVEGCADEFDLSNCLDDSDHWLWELGYQIINRINQNC